MDAGTEAPVTRDKSARGYDPLSPCDCGYSDAHGGGRTTVIAPLITTGPFACAIADPVLASDPADAIRVLTTATGRHPAMPARLPCQTHSRSPRRHRIEDIA